MDRFLNGRKFFNQNPDAKYLVFGAAVNRMLIFLLEHYQKIPASRFDELFRAEFAKMKNLPELSAFLFSRMNLLELNVLQLKRQLAELQK